MRSGRTQKGTAAREGKREGHKKLYCFSLLRPLRQDRTEITIMMIIISYDLYILCLYPSSGGIILLSSCYHSLLVSYDPPVSYGPPVSYDLFDHNHH